MYVCIYNIYIQYDSRHTECSNLTEERVPKCMSCHKAIVVITGRAH